MLGFLSAAIAEAAIHVSAKANATAHKKNIFVDNALILGSFHSLQWIFGLQVFDYVERLTV